MDKSSIGKIIVGAGVVVVLAVGGYAGFNIVRSPSEGVKQLHVAAPTATPSPSDSVRPTTRKMASGEFNYIDGVHHAKGQAVIYETEQGPIVSLENFEVSAGPDLHVYLSRNAGLTAINSPLGAFVSLGKLQSTSGPQTYNLPDNYRDYQSVTIWCRAFQVNFSSAEVTYL